MEEATVKVSTLLLYNKSLNSNTCTCNLQMYMCYVIQVCQPVTSALASGEVSHDLVARLLKYILLKKRTADLASDQVPQKVMKITIAKYM